MRWPSSILSRILGLHALTVAATSVCMPLALYALLRSAADDLHHRALGETADNIARYLELSPDGGWRLELPVGLRELFSDSYGRYDFAILDRQGDALFSSGDHHAAPVFSMQALPPSPTFFQLDANGKRLYGGTFPEVVSQRSLWIQIAEDLNHRDVVIDDVVDDFFGRVGWVTMPILLVLLVINVLIFRHALKPIRQASEMTQKIGPARLDLRLPTDKMPWEILPLVLAVNRALERLEQGFKVQHEFAANAAHELRTPLTILRIHVDTLKDRESALRLRGDVENISRTVNQLLEIAELDAFSVGHEEVADLQAVCSDVAALFAPLAVAEGKSIALMSEGIPVLVRGNSEALARGVSNLVSNAVRHTKAGTTVEVEVHQSGYIRVIDHGEGVADDERELIFRRFWRRDRRRSGSAGLGLSIVTRIVEAHGAAITVANNPGGGAAFTIKFPKLLASGGLPHKSLGVSLP